MWRPPQRIRHELPPGQWPDAVAARAARWFQPIELGPLTLEQRTWVPAMVPWRATEDGHVTRDVLDWYARFAAGRPGAIVVEATGIRDVPSGPLLRIGHDRFVPGLRELCRVVQEASDGHTKLLVQIIDFLRIRRRPEPERFFRQFLVLRDEHRAAVSDEHRAAVSDEHRAAVSDEHRAAVSYEHRAAVPHAGDDTAVREALLALPPDEQARVLDPRELQALRYGEREHVTDLHLPHLRELPRVLPELFAAAARRAREAGFHGVELHYAHAYTMASFLSRHNDRTDGYGGSLAERQRLPLETFARVRAEVGQDYCVGCRYLGDEIIDGGSDLADATAHGVAFAAAGMDFLSLSRGGKFEDAQEPKPGWAAYPYTGPSGHDCMPTVISDEQGPFGRNVEAAATIRAAIRRAGHGTPIVVAGGICSFGQAEGILARDAADVVGAARQTLADPDWFRKVYLGRGAEVRRCKYTNYCEALDQKHKQVTCQLWDRLELDAPDVPLASDGRRRLVAPRWEE